MARGSDKPREVAKSARCPCGSRKRYGFCCARKGFKWQIDPDGGLSKSIPLSDDGMRVVGNLERAFKRHFGRLPSGDDPLMLVRYLYSPDDLARMQTRVMRDAGMDPAKIYASEKTGRIVTTENLKFLSDDEAREWQDAVEEYRSGAVERERKQPNQRLYDALMKELPDLTIALGYLVDRASPSGALVEGGSRLLSVDQYVFMCGLRAVRTLRSIAALLEEHRTSGALALSRSVYELYLHVIFAKAQPHKLADLVDAQVGLWSGTHTRHDRRTIVEKATGKRFDAGFGHFRMSRASGRKSDEALFDFMYPHLSSFIHPHIMTLIPPTPEADEWERDELSEDDPGEAVFYSLLFGAMVVDEILRMPCVGEPVRSDVTFAVRRIRRKAIRLMNLFIDVSEDPRYWELLRGRFKELLQ